MANRRNFLMTLAVGLLSLGVVAAPALAAELLRGKVKEVDTDKKTVKVIPVGEDDDHPGILVRVTAETVISDEDGERVELKDLKKNNGVAVSHENGVASKIVVNKPDDN